MTLTLMTVLVSVYLMVIVWMELIVSIVNAMQAILEFSVR